MVADNIMQCTPGKEHELITLLLEEYKVLRTAITQRLHARGQALGFTTALSALIVASGNLTLRGFHLYVAIFTLAIGLIFWIGSNRAILRIADHVRELERCINDLANRAYGVTENPLTWETMLHDQRVSSGRWRRLARRSIGWR